MIGRYSLILLLTSLAVIRAEAEGFRSALSASSSDNYIVADFASIKPDELPENYQTLEQLNLPADISFNHLLDYHKAILAFSKVFAQQRDFSAAVFSDRLVEEASKHDLDPCYLAGLLASTLQMPDEVKNLSLVALFGQDENSVSSFGKLLQLEEFDSQLLYSEYFVSRYFVRYVALMQELLAGSSALTALAWQLGFDELSLRLGEHNLQFQARDLDRLKVVKEARELCISGAKVLIQAPSQHESSLRTGIDRSVADSDN